MTDQAPYESPVGADWVMVPREVAQTAAKWLRLGVTGNCTADLLEQALAAPKPAEARGVGDGVTELVAKWRKQVRTILGQGPSGAAMLRCAADLEAALAANKPVKENKHASDN